MKIELTTVELADLIYQLRSMYKLDPEDEKPAGEPDKFSEAVEKAIAESVEIVPEKEPGRSKKKKEDPEPEQVIPLDRGKIKALYTAGWSMAKIADEMGCTYQRIDQILKEEGMKK